MEDTGAGSTSELSTIMGERESCLVTVHHKACLKRTNRWTGFNKVSSITENEPLMNRQMTCRLRSIHQLKPWSKIDLVENN